MAADYGSDISCVNDLASDGRTVTGHQLIAEAVARRWLTPRGRLIGYPNYGYDLTQFVNADVNDRDLAELRAGAEAEALKDERVTECTVETTLESDGSLTVTASLEAGDGPFEFTVSVTSVTIQLLSVT